MTTGVLMYCFDTPDFQYHRLADKSISLIHRNLGLPITVVTDEHTHKRWGHREDIHFSVVDVDRNNTKLNKPWYNTERHLSYDMSIYDTTIVLDADYFCFSDKLLKLSQTDYDFLVHKHSHDITGIDSMKNNRHGVIDMVWATVLIFKKTQKTKSVFETVKLIKNNYQHFCNLYRITYRNFRNDFAFAIALNQIYGFGTYDVIPDSIPAVLNNVQRCDFDRNKVYLTTKDRFFEIVNTDLHFINKEVLYV